MPRLTAAATASALVLLAGGLAACSATQRDTDDSSQVTSVPVNTVCPIGGHEITEDAPMVTYKGTTIAFCCEGCYEGWQDMSVAERDEVLETTLEG